MAIYLSLFYYFYFSVVGVYVIFIPKVLEAFYTKSEIGILLAAAPLVRFVLPFLFMKGLKLHEGVFKMALVVFVLGAVSFYLSVENFYALLITNIFLGIGLSLILPYVEVIALEHIGKENYGKVRLFGSIGFVVVSLVLVKFFQPQQYALVFLLFLTCITVASAFVVSMAERQQQKKSNMPTTQQTVHESIALLRDWKLWAGLVLMQISFGAYYNFFTIYETAHSVAMDMTIYLWSFGVLVEVGMLYFQGKLLKRFYLLHLIRLSVFMTVIRWFLIFVFADNIIVLFFAQSLHAFSFALFHSAAISYLYHLYADKKLAQQFFMGLTYGLGGFFGALIAGYVYEYLSDYLFLSSTLFALAALLFLQSFKESCD